MPGRPRDAGRASRVGWRTVLWLVILGPLAAAIAWIGVELERRGFAGIGLHSLVVGLLLGSAAVAALKIVNLATRSAVIVAVVLLAPLTAGLEHLVAYFQFRASYERAIARHPGIAPMPRQAAARIAPPALADYFRARINRQSIALWGLDAALLAVGTAVPLGLALRQPYCRRCKGWYRTVRSGPLTAEETSAWSRRLAAEVPASASQVRRDAAICRAGCRHDLMRLSWRDGRRSSHSPWLPGDALAPVPED